MNLESTHQRTNRKLVKKNKEKITNVKNRSIKDVRQANEKDEVG